MRTRRGMLNVSLSTAVGTIIGPTLSRAFAGDTIGGHDSGKSVILLWLEGGPFQTDTFDPKKSSDQKLGYRYRPISTSSPDLEIAGSLPLLASQGAELTVIRSMVSLEFDHSPAQYYMQTGWRGTGAIQAPSIGSIVSHELGAQPGADLPAFVSIGTGGFPAGYFGPTYQPTVVWDPEQPPENLGLPSGVTPETFSRRLRYLKALENGDASRTFSDRFRIGREEAVRFMRSRHRSAFDLTREPPGIRDGYGRTTFGNGCLLARRLVEAGVRFVQVRQTGDDPIGYDTHENHYKIHDPLIRVLDRGMSSLIRDLKLRGMLDSTVVIAAGEFGRTPTINSNQGRDHWTKGFSIAVAGGGFRGGCSWGSMNDTGQELDSDPVSVPDFLATLCHAIGIDHTKEYVDDFKRPIRLVDEGHVIHDILT
ncbi:MAG: DUF1501 domain-containing protein [Fuerstiella sp.]|nr:DUF1501 domain-containing protein [Fuerstiella sp.]